MAQLFLQSASAYSCISELGERGLLEFRDVSRGWGRFGVSGVQGVRLGEPGCTGFGVLCVQGFGLLGFGVGVLGCRGNREVGQVRLGLVLGLPVPPGC